MGAARATPTANNTNYPVLAAVLAAAAGAAEAAGAVVLSSVLLVRVVRVVRVEGWKRVALVEQERGAGRVVWVAMDR